MGYDIRDRACFKYLLEINKHIIDHPIPEYEASPYVELLKVINDINFIFIQNIKYSNKINYAKWYRQFQEAAENVALYEFEQNKFNLYFDSLFIKIFENNNEINRQVFDDIVNLREKSAKKTSAKSINEALRSKTVNTNRSDFRHPDNPINAFFKSLLGWFNYHPLHENNIPYLNTEGGTSEPRNIRFGAQLQGKETVNPTFERYLIANARRNDVKTNIKSDQYHHLYINLQKRPQSEQAHSRRGLSKMIDKFVRNSEGRRSIALEGLNKKSVLKTAVVTLPADNDFLLKNYHVEKGKAKNNKTEDGFSLFKTLTESIMFNKNDYYIPDEISKKLFGDDYNSIRMKLKNRKPQSLSMTDVEKIFEGNLGTLFKEAVKDITGINIDKISDLEEKLECSPEVRTAILFHFVKSPLTEHILKEVNPQGYNIACKDAIDRAAMHTLWQKMNQQYNQKNPMEMEEFLRYMDAPAILVKYRAANHNRNLLWNVLNERMKNDHDFAIVHPWAVQWLKENNPEFAHQKKGSKKVIFRKVGEQQFIKTALDPAPKNTSRIRPRDKT